MCFCTSSRSWSFSAVNFSMAVEFIASIWHNPSPAANALAFPSAPPLHPRLFGALLISFRGLKWEEEFGLVMNTMFAGIIGGWEIVLILAVVLILFGAKKLPELAKGLGQGIKEFKKASREVTEEIQNAADDTPPPSPQRKLPESNPASSASTVSQAPSNPKA